MADSKPIHACLCDKSQGPRSGNGSCVCHDQPLSAAGAEAVLSGASVADVIKKEYNKYKSDKFFWATIVLAILLVIMSMWLIFRAK